MDTRRALRVDRMKVRGRHFQTHRWGNFTTQRAPREVERKKVKHRCLSHEKRAIRADHLQKF